MNEQLTRAELLLNRLYAAADTLLETVIDPVRLQDATLTQRASALNAVAACIERIEKRFDSYPEWVDEPVESLQLETATGEPAAPQPSGSSLANVTPLPVLERPYSPARDRMRQFPGGDGVRG